MSLHSKTRIVSARVSCVSLLNVVLSYRGCCPFERPLGMGGSQSAGWSAEAADLSETRGKRNVCAWWSRAADYLDPAHTMARPGRGQLLEEFERSERRLLSRGAPPPQRPRYCSTRGKDCGRFVAPSADFTVKLSLGSLRLTHERFASGITTHNRD